MTLIVFVAVKPDNRAVALKPDLAAAVFEKGEDPDRRGGFVFQPVRYRNYRGHETDIPGAYSVDHGKPYSPIKLVEDQGEWLVALLARRKTDILAVDIDSWPAGVWADPLDTEPGAPPDAPKQVEGRAAWYSFAFFLRTAAAAVLDIDTTELDAGFRTTLRDDVPAGQAFLSDRLENGAGYCKWLEDPGNFANLLKNADPLHARGLAEKWLDPDHAGAAGHHHRCDASCNRCLRDFNNLQYHGLLDWRLALDMARLALDPHAIIDLESDWAPMVMNPWKPICDGPGSVIASMMTKLQYCDPVRLGEMWTFVNGKQNGRPTKGWVVCHPLWREDHDEYQAAKAALIAAHPDLTRTSNSIGRLNPFRALRRIADYIA